MTDYAYPVGSTVGVTELGSHEGELELPEGTRGVVLEIIENDMGYDQAEVDFGQYGVHVTYDDQVTLATAQIQVGDKVRLTGDSWPSQGLGIGTIVTVDGVDPDGEIWAGEAGTVGVNGRLYGVDNPYPHNHDDYSCELVVEPPVKQYASRGVVLSPESMGLLEKAIVSPTEVTVNVPFETALRSVLDATDPNHYKFPGGAEVRHISEWLTANAAQALQYIARSSRIDGQNKGDAREDLRKAIRFLEFELERLDV